MGFLDNIGEKIDNLGEKITKTGQGAVNKTKELAEIAKLTLAVKEEERKISEAHETIGREYVEKFAGSADRILPEVFEQISESEKEIASLNERIRELKGISICAECGAEVENGVKFCPKCGAAVKKKGDIIETTAVEAPVCPKCQAPIEEGQEVCVVCGEQLTK